MYLKHCFRSSRERKERRKFSSISWFTRSSRIRTSSSTFGRGGFNNDFGGFDGGFRGRGGRGGRGGWRGRGNDNFRGGGGPPDMGFGRGGRGRRGGFGGVESLDSLFLLKQQTRKQ